MILAHSPNVLVSRCSLGTLHKTYNKVLDGSNDRLLETGDSLGSQLPTEVWVIAEALPVTAAFCQTSQWSYHRTQSRIDTLSLELSSHEPCAGVCEISVPAGANVDTACIRVHAVSATNTVASIVQT